jgi:hypothetical protein
MVFHQEISFFPAKSPDPVSTYSSFAKTGAQVSGNLDLFTSLYQPRLLPFQSSWLSQGASSNYLDIQVQSQESAQAA